MPATVVHFYIRCPILIVHSFYLFIQSSYTLFADFRIFLLGDTGEPFEEPVREEPKQETIAEEDENKQEGGDEKKEGEEEKKEEEVKKEEPKKPELSAEEKAKRERRKALMMGYTMKIQAEEKKRQEELRIQEEKRKEEERIKQEKDEEERKREEEKRQEEEKRKEEERRKVEEEERQRKKEEMEKENLEMEHRGKRDSGIGSESDLDFNRPGSGIISVTVKHTAAENGETEDVFESQSASGSAKRPSSSRPMSATPSVRSIAEDVTIIDDDSEHEFGEFADDFQRMRTSSARSRLLSGKSRVSSGCSRLSKIQESGAGSSISELTDLNLSKNMDSMALSDDEEPIKNNKFTHSLSDRQSYYIQNFDSRHGY